ncbi:glycoside hydrolase family 2 protein [Uliginosibacterium gangwonense]|uniref:glycoside hydrolase family 2 protein n=1 Tax=Uliginosibacterium gangwonense TaxID=392736 RepID=UPI000380A424|nr:glycoside hydrolase family 2 TIM barrel-domain containing protein [Uliginosibacterium gangwonense]
MRKITKLNAGWTFHNNFSSELVAQASPGETVRLPHNAVDLEMNYFDERCYQKEFGYQKILPWSEEFADREISLVFDGAMANSMVWLNGQEVAHHKDGYTPFEARLTGLLKHGDNLITVKIDGSENPEIPPFGGQIDYLTYAGIYRDVWLKLTDAVAIRHIKIETAHELSDAKSVSIVGVLGNPQGLLMAGQVQADLCDMGGAVLHSKAQELTGEHFRIDFDALSGLALWELEHPQLYRVVVRIQTTQGRDEISSRFGFRTAQFTPDGFRLNGKALKIRGLNRHQSYPYVGYAMGKRAQEKDADILKYELKCNLARTSHYPQSPYFLDRCDEIGLLVFEEIPGWQHIGGQAWQDESVENVRRMIERDWNHPSIVLWGVRINESQDSHDFYTRTNALAHALDSTRQTGGVRFLQNSELLEDVYTINDFANGAPTEFFEGQPVAPLRAPRHITGLDRDVPYFVTECNGHMYPTKRIDAEHRQSEHVTRHLQILDAAYANPNISGVLGWCMNDYNTHKDFGAGDRICHHGVMDILREPKFAAYAYTSQCEPDEQIVLEPVTYWARGEKDRCEVLPLIVLTNCDYVELKFGDFMAKRAEPDRTAYPHLPHAPVIIDSRHVNINDLGAWGMLWQDGVITGFIDGKPVAQVRLSGNPVPTTLEVKADDLELIANDKDATRIIIRALDQAGRLLPFLDDVVNIKLTGQARVLGPDVLLFRGGIAACWIETTGETGPIDVQVTTRRLGEKHLKLAAR